MLDESRQKNKIKVRDVALDREATFKRTAFLSRGLTVVEAPK